MKPEVKLICSSPDIESSIVHAARVCYKSEGQADSKYEIAGLNTASDGSTTLKYPVLKIKLGPNDEKLLRKLLTNKHSAALRFGYAHFYISNISRAAAFQICRIAHAGILMKSDRYTNVGGNPIVCPVDDEWFSTELDKVYRASDSFYKEALSRGFKKEDARYGKLSGSTTELHFSGNMQMFKHFLSIRLNKKVMKETLIVAISICKELFSLAPLVFEDEYKKAIELEKYTK